MNRSIKSLARAYHDRTLSKEEVAELDQILSSDVKAREVFLREANLIAALEEVASEEPSDAPPVSQLPLSDHAHRESPQPRSARWTMAAGWLVAAATALLMIDSFRSASSVMDNATPDKTIATIVGVSGPLQWTGDGGRVRSDLSIGMELPGGTIDGLSPESWFALEFKDGSTVITSGNSMLAFSDVGQKVLHLKSGNLSADVSPQKPGFPMLIHTRSAVLEVLGTSFEVDADLASTALNVTEGNVGVQRRSDGQRVEVPAQHQVVAAADRDLRVKQVPQVVHAWRSRFENGPRRTYGRWLPSTTDTLALLHCIAHMTEDGQTIYTSAAQVTTADAAPVMTNDRTLVKVSGRLDRKANLFVGMSLRTVDGKFAGRFQVVLPQNDADSKDAGVSETDSSDKFDVSLPIEDFELDPSLADMSDQLPKSPHGLIVESIWCHTLFQQAGLAVASFELTERRSSLVHEQLDSSFRSPFDAFLYVNRIPSKPEPDETPEDLAGRILGRLANQEGRVLVKLPPGINRRAYQGFKVALGSESHDDFRSACVACHQLPDLGNNTTDPPTPSLRNPSISIERLRELLQNETHRDLKIDDDQVERLHSFLETLTDVPDAEFRNLILNTTVLDTSGDNP